MVKAEGGGRGKIRAFAVARAGFEKSQTVGPPPVARKQRCRGRRIELRAKARARSHEDTRSQEAFARKTFCVRTSIWMWWSAKS
eukprot:2623482-Pleurochrysis_carterae.AAC.1